MKRTTSWAMIKLIIHHSVVCRSVSVQICLCENTRASHTPILNDVVFHTWCSTRMHDSTHATPAIIIEKRSTFAAFIPRKQFDWKSPIAIVPKRMGSAWWFSFPNTRASHGVSSERTQSGNSANESLDDLRKMVDFHRNVRPSKNICLRDPKFLDSFRRPSGTICGSSMQNWIGTQEFGFMQENSVARRFVTVCCSWAEHLTKIRTRSTVAKH